MTHNRPHTSLSRAHIVQASRRDDPIKPLRSHQCSPHASLSVARPWSPNCAQMSISISNTWGPYNSRREWAWASRPRADAATMRRSGCRVPCNTLTFGTPVPGCIRAVDGLLGQSNNLLKSIVGLYGKLHWVTHRWTENIHAPGYLHPTHPTYICRLKKTLWAATAPAASLFMRQGLQDARLIKRCSSSTTRGGELTRVDDWSIITKLLALVCAFKEGVAKHLEITELGEGPRLVTHRVGQYWYWYWKYYVR